MRWTPQAGPQSEFVCCEAFEVVYGGARGGGKTDALLGEFAYHAVKYGRWARGLLVRRTRVSLEPTLTRAREIFAPFGGVFVDSRSRFEWPSGASLSARHLQTDADAELYQGHDYSRLCVEELTQFPRGGPLDKLKATLRSAGGVRCGLRATCNPGGPGHAWVKARYIDPGPRVRMEDSFRDPFTGEAHVLDRVFIPARLTDNPKLLARDPTYVARLQQCGSEALVRAWLDGDWSAVEGAFFDRWSERNILAPFALPPHWTRIRSFDWGSAAPFSVGWWAVAGDDTPARGGIVPRGALIRYREWYGAGRDGRGLRLDAETVAAGILAREAGERMADAVADPAIFAHNGGPSIGERMAQAGCLFRPADNTRVGRAGPLSGWDQVRARIGGPDERPMLYVFDTCREFIRTVPALGHDPARPEDLDTDAEDHIADETRYACLSRPMIAKAPEPPPGPSGWDWQGMRRRDEARWLSWKAP